MAINGGRVLIGGLAAGGVIILSALLMVPVVGQHMADALAARGLAPLGAGAAIFIVAASLANGLLLVWLYAAVRPRFGAGPRTAVRIAVVVWFMAYGVPNASNAIFGFMPAGLTVVGTLWGLVELVLAGLVGARLYRER